MSATPPAAAHPPGQALAVSLHRRLYLRLLDPHAPGNLHLGVDRFVAALTIAKLLALLRKHVPALHEACGAWLDGVDVVSVIVFTLEHLLRL